MKNYKQTSIAWKIEEKKKKEKATMHSSFYLVRDGLIKCYCKNSEIMRESRLSIIKRIENVSEQGRSKGKVKNGN